MPPDTAPVVSCQSLTKVFKDFWLRSRVRAVDDVTFEIYPGEIFGLLGPNGSGKSTTIKVLLGLLHKTRGRVTVFGKLPTDVAVKRRIGYLPEESYLYAFLNARETLDYYGKLFEIDYRVRQKRIDELLEMVGLSAVQHRPVKDYSKGMQRRIGIAQALINDPELLILDEPTTGLDPIGTRQIKDLILELGRRGKTVLLSSHLLPDVEDCVDRMVIYYGGRIRAAGTCDSLLTSREKSVLEFDALDEATISEIDAVVRRRSGGTRSLTRATGARQRLEDLFIDIVEKARAERLETAGAQHGGRTAAFLRGGEDQDGSALISTLVEAGTREPGPSRTAASPAAPRGPDETVIGSLVNSASAPRPSSQSPSVAGTAGGPAPPASPAAEPDQSVIGSLLDGGADTGSARSGGRP